MALLRGKLLAGALFAGLLFGAPDQGVATSESHQAHQAANGGGLYDAGQAWVQSPAHTWVKVVKAGVVRVKTPSIAASVSGDGVVTKAVVKAEGSNHEARGSTAWTPQSSGATLAWSNTLSAGVSGGTLITRGKSVALSSKIGFDYLSIDELLTLLMV